MSEDTVEVSETPPELTEIEKTAVEHGWRPQSEFEADPKNEGKKHRSAEEFMDRKPLFDKIDEFGRKVKEQDRAIKALIDHNKKVEDLAYEKVLSQLKAEKKAALEEGNADKVIEIDDKIIDFKTNPPQTPPQAPQEVQQIFRDWVADNDWYVKDMDMRASADAIGVSLAKSGLAPTELFSKVRNQVEKLYPEKFGKIKALSNPVDSGSRKPSSGTAVSDVRSQMSDMERRVMDTIVRTGMDSKEYLKQFVATQPERFKGVKL